VRWLTLLLCLLLLCGCSAAEPEPAAEPEQASDTVRPLEIVEVPMRVGGVTEVEMEVSPEPVWRGSEPQQGEPIIPQPGDTAETWDSAAAAEVPPKEACTPLEWLEAWMAVEGLTWSDLDERDCDQLVLVTAHGTGKALADVTCFRRQKDGTWDTEAQLTDMTGYTGSAGIAHNRRRGSETSPAGLWALGSAFGLEEEPEGLKVPWRSITEQSDWVGDRHSIYFNTWQERDDPDLADSWNTAEHLADYDETYTYACVIEFNTPPYVVPERGFAIFLHVSDHPTTGCIGLETENMVRTLQWLDPHRKPHILITGYEE